MRLRKKILIGVLITAALAAAGLWYVVEHPLPARIRVAAVKKGPAVEAVYATATIEPVNWSAIAALEAGRVIEIAVREGAEVEKGDLLARLDDSEFRARLKELEARRTFLEEEAARAQELFKRKVGTIQRVQQTRSDLDQINSAITEVKSHIEHLALKAPMSGTVLWRDVELGEVVRQGQTVFWVGQPRPLWAVAEVDEEDIPRVRRGQDVLINADAFPGQVLQGTVGPVTPKGDPINKSYRVRVSLPDDTPLMIGMTVETNIIVRKTEEALLIPRAALIGGSRVFVFDKGIAGERAVKTGVVGSDSVEITSGLEEGEKVIFDFPETLLDKSPVVVTGH